MTKISDTSSPTRSPGLDAGRTNAALPESVTRRTLTQQGLVVKTGLDKGGTLSTAAKATQLVAKSSIGASANATGSTAGSRFVGAASQAQFGAEPVLPTFSSADLATAAAGTATAWTSLTSLGAAARGRLSFVVPEGQTLTVAAGEKSTALSGPLELASETLGKWQQNAPRSFAKPFADLTGKETTLDATTGELTFNRDAVKQRGDWVGTDAQQAAKQQEALQQVLEHAVEDERQRQNQQQQGGRDDEEDDDTEEAAAEAVSGLHGGASVRPRRLVPVADNPEAFATPLPESYRAALESASLPTLESIGSSLTTQASLYATGKTEVVSSTSTSTSTSSSSSSSILDILNDPSLSIEDKIALFMAAMSENYEQALEDKMEEAAAAEQAEAAGTTTSGKSSTILMQEVQILTQKWKQMTELSSTLLKTLHDTAMSIIRRIG